MKLILKKILKILLVFIISTITIYLIFTASEFYKWCEQNSLLSIFNPFYGATDDLKMIEKDKIKEIGDYVGAIETQMEKGLEGSSYINDGENHYFGDGHNHKTIAEIFNTKGYSVWLYMYGGLRDVFTKYNKVAILLGIVTTIAYIIITTKKMNSIVKVVLGYVLPMIIFPPIYMYSYTNRFWDINTMYFKGTPKYFYLIYTIIFVILYVTNYIINVKKAKKLNEAIKNKENISNK